MTTAARSFRLEPFSATTLSEMERRERDPDVWRPWDWFGFGSTGMPQAGPQVVPVGGATITPDGGKLAIVGPLRQLVGRVQWFPGYWYGGSPRHRGWGVGLIVFPEWRGTAAAHTALRELIDYLFQNTTAHRIEGVTSAPAAKRDASMHPLGMTREGVIREAQWQDGAWRDVVLFSLLRSEWSRAAPGARTPQRDGGPTLDTTG